MSRKAIYGGFLSRWRGLGLGRGSGTLVPATSQQEMTARRVMPHRHGHSLQVTPQDPPKTQMCCLRRGTSSRTLSHKTWKQDQKEKSKARSQIKTRTSPHPKQPPSTNSKKYGADSSVPLPPPPSPQLDTGRLLSRHVPTSMQRAGLGRPVPGSRQTGAPADGSSLGR